MITDNKIMTIPQNELKTVKVAAAAIVCGDRFLAACRPEGKRFSGLWEFPGGKLETGESFEQACVREIKEELACDIQPEAELLDFSHDYENFRLCMRIFKCRLLNGTFPQLIIAEHLGLVWVNADEARALDWVPADKERLDSVLEALKRSQA